MDISYNDEHYSSYHDFLTYHISISLVEYFDNSDLTGDLPWWSQPGRPPEIDHCHDVAKAPEEPGRLLGDPWDPDSGLKISDPEKPGVS